MNKYYISFGQAHTCEHKGEVYDKDSLMLVEAENELEARRKVYEICGPRWSSIYHESELPKMLHYYPRGVL